jgi:hypothetical protein
VIRIKKSLEVNMRRLFLSYVVCTVEFNVDVSAVPYVTSFKTY